MDKVFVLSFVWYEDFDVFGVFWSLDSAHKRAVKEPLETSHGIKVLAGAPEYLGSDIETGLRSWHYSVEGYGSSVGLFIHEMTVEK